MTITIEPTHIDDLRRLLVEYHGKEGNRRFAGALFAGKIGKHEWCAACRSVSLEIASVNPKEVDEFDRLVLEQVKE